MLKITLDTNSIINLLDASSASATSVSELMEIMRFGMEGEVNIAITSRVEYDISKDTQTDRKAAILHQLGMFPMIGAGFRLDMSKLGGADFLTNETHERLSQEVTDTLFPNLDRSSKHASNKIADVDHVVGHIYSKRDAFITDDGGILKKASILEEKFGIKVMTPKQCLDILSTKQSPLPIVIMFREKWEGYTELLSKYIKEDQEISEVDNRKYKEYREWFVRNFPKIKTYLANSRFEQNSQNIGRQRVIQDDVLRALQYDVNPFEEFYAGTTLDKAVNTLRDSWSYRANYHSSTNKSFEEWLTDDLVATKDYLISLEGYLEK